MRDRFGPSCLMAHGCRECRKVLRATFARVGQVGVLLRCHWAKTAPFPPRLPLSFHTHTQPLNNDNNDQDGYYRIFLAVADQFNGNTLNDSISQLKSLFGGGTAPGIGLYGLKRAAELEKSLCCLQHSFL